MSVGAAQVLVHGVLVGELERLNDNEDFIFRFDEDWLSMTAPPTLGQIFEDRRPRAIETSGLPCWFAHLLPQGPWRRHLQSWAELDEDDDDDFALLIAMGRDLPGALTLEPATHRTYSPSVRVERPPPAQENYRFSLAGAQWKLSVQDRDGRLVIPVYGSAGDYIAKMESPAYPGLPRVEHAITSWARKAGLCVHDTELVSVERFVDLPPEVPQQEGRCLLLKRFDRSPDGAIHMEDFGQITDRPPANLYRGNYEEIAALVHWLCPEDAAEFVRRLVFMMASGNGDAHLKNWSVVYPDKRKARLSPAYDLISTVIYLPGDRLALALAQSKEHTVFTPLVFDDIARALCLEVEQVRSWATDFWVEILDAWEREGLNIGLTVEEQGRIQNHINRLSPS